MARGLIWVVLGAAGFTAGPGAALSLLAADARVEFSRDVLPVLADNCFACHGPDDQERKAKLRLDRPDDLQVPRKSGGQVVVPGEPAKSLLVQRITTADSDDVMPPPKTGKKLTPSQVGALTRWIQEGGRWEMHWAFQKPERPTLPAVRQKQWPRNPIDRFVLARLEKEGLKPSPEASRTTLIRRGTLAATGLPPTPQEVDAFLADKRPEAYERLVDRLLESPRRGEHLARAWLDAARYADTHGYHIDSERSVWKYRDWVIGAFNRNLPFDRFTIEQLAGDLQPDATVEQKIATGYLRCNMSTGEGGAIEDEYAAKYAFDRTETTSTIWLGMTMTCARCHTHKYDPVTQKEYYRLFAFFANLDGPVMDGNRPNPEPFLKLPTAEQRERIDWLKQHIEDGQAGLDATNSTQTTGQAAWLTRWSARLAPGVTPLKPVRACSTNGTDLAVLDDGSVLARGAHPTQELYEVVFDLPAGKLGGLRLEALPHDSFPHAGVGRGEGGAFQVSEMQAEYLPPAEAGAESKPETLSFSRAVADRWEGDYDAGKAVDKNPDTAWRVEGEAAVGHRAALFVLGKVVEVPAGAQLRVWLAFPPAAQGVGLGRFALSAVTGSDLLAWLFPPPDPVWQVLGPFPKTNGLAAIDTPYEPERVIDFSRKYPGVREEIGWQARDGFEDGPRHILVDELHGVHGVYYLHRTLVTTEPRSFDVVLRADDVFKLWVNDDLVAARREKEKPGDGPVRVTVHLAAGTNRFLVKVVNHQGSCGFQFRREEESLDRLPPGLAAVIALGPEPWRSNAAQVREYYLRGSDPEWRQRANQVGLWREELDGVEQSVVTTMVAKELEPRRETRILLRGEYDKKGDPVAPGVPAILPPWPAGAPTNRLGLAQWLVSPEHPLTARVTVNRLWQQCFGVGLVKTAEDFGIQGERPSHPDLLDWLATELMASGWDLRHVQRLILTSATYRQSARVPPALEARDPENRLLARGPRFREEGEVVRDAALAISGLLVEQVGGRSVKPYEPPGLWEAVSFNNSQKYVQDSGDANYRRSLYTFWKRQSPPPNMLLFDAPTREYCIVRRPRTNTPLQALDLLNDPQFVEASRAFAQRMMREGGRRPDERAAYGFRLATSRRPDGGELKLLVRLYEQQRDEFRRQPEKAAQFLSVGTFVADPALDRAELAAWATVATLILNLDETVSRG